MITDKVIIEDNKIMKIAMIDYHRQRVLPLDGSSAGVHARNLFPSVLYVNMIHNKGESVGEDALIDKLDDLGFCFIPNDGVEPKLWWKIDLFERTYTVASDKPPFVLSYEFAKNLDFSEFKQERSAFYEKEVKTPIADKLIDLVLVKHLSDASGKKYCFRCEVPVEVGDLVLCVTRNGAVVSKVTNVMKAVSEPNIEFVAQCIGVKEITGEVLGKYVYIDKDCKVDVNNG